MRRTMIALAAATALLAACSSPEEDICDGKCGCEGCTSYEHAKCLQDLDAERAAADYRGCVPTYHDLAACEAATGTCVGGKWETACKPEHESYKACVDDK